MCAHFCLYHLQDDLVTGLQKAKDILLLDKEPLINKDKATINAAIFTSLLADGFKAPVKSSFELGEAAGPVNMIKACYDLQGGVKSNAGKELKSLLNDLRLTEKEESRRCNFSNTKPFDPKGRQDLMKGK